MSIFELPRYRENPIYLYFESYIVHSLGKMSQERYVEIQSIDLQRVFESSHSDWKKVVAEVLDLSDTIEIAIKHLWVKNRECYEDNEAGYIAYAQDFTDQFMKENSKVDIWTKDSFLAAIDEVNSSRLFDE